MKRTKFIPVPVDVFKDLESQDSELIIGKMEILLLMLEAQNIDEDKYTMPGSDPVFKNIFDKEEAKRIKKKLFELTDLI
jgi:hypothetical protein